MYVFVSQGHAFATTLLGVQQRRLVDAGPLINSRIMVVISAQKNPSCIPFQDC